MILELIKTGRKVLSAMIVLVLAFPCTAAAAPHDSEPGPPEAESEGVQAPILMYHSVLNDSSQWGTYVISPAELESDLKYLRDSGYTAVVMQDLIDYARGGKALPEKPVVLTFDDGYYNNFLYAFPLLKKYNMKAVVSIIGRYTDAYSLSDADHPGYSHITWTEAIEMVNSGTIELQNHSYNLHTINRERTASMRVSGEPLQHYEAVLVSDTVRLQGLIQSYTGRLPTTYTYPFGLISKDSVPILKELGFQASLSCYSGVSTVTRNPDSLFLLKRNLRPHGKTAEFILRKLQ